ncbi:3-oxoacyl-[acyl-carrier protein] reductase [Lentibacillus halodurans]|uniref:3-oxoacyl-[acyl-carrier protein] reductase n=1 Tax=Lentibacillus halodurans TaxID=237679 RepID=A0A1I0VI44_9BACI|nr:SDR family NAD(P)-dependent oxidoreductase [Lentibacillus halodurans]SFA76159.1 3-oxoacyl-[acyl-carrier protein] reductase [Lentibacillus halodurans]
MKLENNVSIVTGASRGIGAATAKSLAKEGSHIVLVDLLDCNETAERIKQNNPNVEVVAQQCDIKKREQVENVINETVDRFGRLDVVVNNAGTCSRLSLEHMTDDMWFRDIDTNLKGTFLFTQSAIYPHMKNQGSGKIINVSSISGIMGGPISGEKSPSGETGRSGPAYAASKGGIIALTKWVAKEVGELGINCNSIAPGPVETEITKGMNYKLNQAIQRMGTPEDIAEAAVYLASPGADYVTGEVLKVCGGSAIG